ncbi:Pol protein [Phytophthora palmivora]|uniref:Pol protein n=1 Tax=Phytophthora palmivora TaxID=4796 RepID=A0A2P4XYI4_9STRA|nr:Pol protein [Phytophthora palmivora]
MALAQDRQKEYSDTKGRGNLNVFKREQQVEAPLHRTLRGPGQTWRGVTIDLPKSMTTHPTFSVGRLKLYHDPLGPSSLTEEGQGENSPPRIEAESSGQLELPVSKSGNDTQTGTHASHTKGMTVPDGKSLGHPTMHLMA